MAQQNPAASGDNESRIADQRLRDLQQQASDASAAANTAKAEAAAARGELDRALTENAGLKAQVERLTTANQQLAESSAARDGMPSLPVDLPKNASQLLDSVTIAVIGEDGKPLRANAKRGDVVFVAPKDGELDELQQAVGLVARVHAVTKAQAEELRTLKLLRG